MPKSGTLSEKDKIENARVGYQAAVTLMTYDGQLIWARFNAMFVAHSIIVAAIAFTISGRLSSQFFSLAFPIIGLVLCVLWFLVTVRSFGNFANWIYSARELEEMCLLQPVKTLSRGGPFAEGKEVQFRINGKEKNLQMPWPGRILKARKVAYGVIALFIALYILTLFCGRASGEEAVPTTQQSYEDPISDKERLDALERDVVEFKTARSFFNATLNSHVAICVAIVLVVIGLDVLILRKALAKHTDQKLDELRVALEKRFGELKKDMTIAQARRAAEIHLLTSGILAQAGNPSGAALCWLQSASLWHDAGDTGKALLALTTTLELLQKTKKATDLTRYRNSFGEILAALERKEEYQELTGLINEQLARIDKGIPSDQRQKPEQSG